MNSNIDVIIVGAGLAGLTCADHLSTHGLRCRLFEASDRVGGRIATDVRSGFRLDRGFQVFLTAYPEARREFDYRNLELKRFDPGALIRYGGSFHRFSDPWRRPQHALATAFSPVATLADKLRLAKFRRDAVRFSMEQIYHRPETTTIEMLRRRGFSDTIIQRFFRPFFGGVFLENHLNTSSRMCEFVFRMFSPGDAALPAKGMEQLPLQLASRLEKSVINLNCPIQSASQTGVVTSAGEHYQSRAIVIATEGPTASQLLGTTPLAPARSVRCIYFATEKAPIREPILVLNGDDSGPINNLCVPSVVSKDYAPAGKSLVSVTVTQETDEAAETLLTRVRSQLNDWFGPSASEWEHLHTYHIKYALPSQKPPALEPVEKPTKIRQGIFVCGDHCDTASINGAIAAGRRAAIAAQTFCEAN